jgi:hypothetical protein
VSPDPKPTPDPGEGGIFTPDELAALRKYIRLRRAGVPFVRFPLPKPFTDTVYTCDAEGNFVSERPATEEEREWSREKRRRLGLE